MSLIQPAQPAARLARHLPVSDTTMATLAGLAALAFIFTLALLITPAIAPSTFLYGPGLATRLLSWDGQWYQFIAEQGYHWDRLTGSRFGHYQNIAFFPLFPLITHALAILSGSTSPWLFILTGLLFDGLAIFAFARLCNRTLRRDHTIIATLLFAAWPAACFAFMGYPVGLINLCTIITLEQRRLGNRWLTALWCGLGTAASPMLIFLAIGLALDEGCHRLRHRTPGDLPAFATRALLSIAGVLAFMAWLAITHHPPLAFLSAQAAWSKPVSFPRHLQNLLDPATYLAPVAVAIHATWLAVSQHPPTGRLGRLVLGMIAENTIGFLSFLFLTFLALQQPRRWATLTPLACMAAGYLWFSVTEGHRFIVACRLLYPCLILLLPTSTIWTTRPRLPASLLPVAVTTASLFLALVLRGYAIT